MRRLVHRLRGQAVPLLFLVVIAAGMLDAPLRLSIVAPDVLERFSRNLVLVLSLVIPIVAGMGLNFGIVLGAMAGQTGLIYVQNASLPGLGGLTVAVIASLPVAMLLGYLTGLLFNRARGREMVTGIMVGLLASGIWQFVFLILAGPVIPLGADDVLLPQGMGLRNTINLTTVERSLDDVVNVPLRWGGVHWGALPLATLGLSALLCLGVAFFFRTKLGQDLRAVGQDYHVAEVAGIRVRRCRIVAIVLSMALAGIGQILWLQNITVMNTFQSHEQVGFYAVAALLVGGATVARASLWNVVLGTLLFHALIVVISLWGQARFHSAQIGEFIREFAAFAIIGAALALHAWRGRRAPPAARRIVAPAADPRPGPPGTDDL